APRGAAGPATLIADGRRSVGLLSAELCLTLKTRGRGGGVQLLVAGRRGVTLALQAVAQAQPERPLVFALSLADGEELAAAGLHPPGQGGTGGASDEAAPPGGEEAPAPRRGFRFFFPGHADEAETMDVRVGAAPSRVLLVKSEGSLLPLTKAVATEVARLPEGATAAVETLLGGKAKSIWTRTHRMSKPWPRPTSGRWRPRARSSGPGPSGAWRRRWRPPPRPPRSARRRAGRAACCG
ncbi:unnamed protein product, partial [Prorocentrum cordatum]